jgi:hypothetical protein
VITSLKNGGNDGRFYLRFHPHDENRFTMLRTGEIGLYWVPFLM